MPINTVLARAADGSLCVKVEVGVDRDHGFIQTAPRPVTDSERRQKEAWLTENSKFVSGLIEHVMEYLESLNTEHLTLDVNSCELSRALADHAFETRSKNFDSL
jgi:hypothetical protein